MAAIPNATVLGFTGTPIDKIAYGKGTFKVSGRDDDKGYLEKYSISESIEDGTTLPLNYTLAPNDIRVVNINAENTRNGILCRKSHELIDRSVTMI